MITVSWRKSSITAMLLMALPALTVALQPPTQEQLERYRRDGSLPEREEAALQTGNHRVAPHLIQNLAARYGAGGVNQTKHLVPGGLQAIGHPRVFALLIDFSDHRSQTDTLTMDGLVFGDGDPAQYPYESLRNYYLRSSYGQLDINGTTLGWYTTPYPRSNLSIANQPGGDRETLISEAISYLDNQGHDFSQYDNDGDGTIDYFLVFWAGPPGEFATGWWAYQRSFQDTSFTVDGKRLGAYSWQWEKWSDAVPAFPLVAIHETGHALGLNDYYDYYGPTGPPGGVGTIDIMDGHGDHNCFSKLLLGWIEPVVYTAGSSEVTLAPSAIAPQAAVLMIGDPSAFPFTEFFMVQNRQRSGNDSSLPGSGLMIWHVDARLSSQGEFMYNNGTTSHKLLRLIEADGLEEIEQDKKADSGDYYRPGDVFCTDTAPSSHRYDGTATGLCLHSITESDSSMSMRVSFDSGCAVSCGVSVPIAAWPGHPVSFDGAATVVNCGGTFPLTTEWSIDGRRFSDASVELSLTPPGSYPWSFDAPLGNSDCMVRGVLPVCRDERCWQWHAVQPMSGGRWGHSATMLLDGRILVVGGGVEPQLFDPSSGSWVPAGETQGQFSLTVTGVLLDNGRVLVVGSSQSDTVDTEIFDPQSGSWSVAGQLAASRFMHAAARLDDGRVLVVGGYWFDSQGTVPVLQAEVFDPHTESWHPAGSISQGMAAPRLTPLEDGRVLLTGMHTATFFDPDTETWTPTSDLGFSRSFHAAVRLDDGRVMVIGGVEANQEEVPWRAEIFDPVTEVWSLTSAMSTSTRLMPAAVVLDSGQVVVCGGADFDDSAQSSVEVYDPTTDAWTLAPRMTEPRFFHSASLLDDGTILIVGGTASEASPDFTSWVPSATAERFAPPVAQGVAPRRVGSRY